MNSPFEDRDQLGSSALVMPAMQIAGTPEEAPQETSTQLEGV